MKKNIILIGFMGTGKSAVGHLLSDSLGMEYTDTDLMIERRAGKRISEIFESSGEKEFRDLETYIIDEIKRTGQVVSTGGGIILRPENVAKLKKLGSIVLLWADVDVIYKRLKGDLTRPLLQGPDPLGKIRELLKSRQAVYNSVSPDVEIDTSLLSPEEACNRIIKELSGKNGQN